MTEIPDRAESSRAIDEQDIGQRLGSLALLCAERHISPRALTGIVATVATQPPDVAPSLLELEVQTGFSRGSVYNGVQVLKHVGLVSSEEDNSRRQGPGGRPLRRYRPTIDLTQAIHLNSEWRNAVELRRIAHELQLSDQEALSEIIRAYREPNSNGK